MEPLAVGVDVGSTNTKVALVAVGSPRVLRVVSRPTPSRAADLTGLVCRLIGEVAAGAAVRPAVVGVASMAETGVPLDRDGAALCELLRWDTGRGHDDAAALAAEYGADRLFAATGVRVSGKVPLVTWRWLRRTRPAVWRAMARWAGAADLIGLALTGHLGTDHTLAGRTMAYRLPEPGAALPPGFDADLLAAAGLRPEQLPAVCGAAGTVTDAAAATTGLAAGTPVVIAGHDHQVGAWAAGAREPGAVADSLGTAESLIRVLREVPDRAAVAAQGMSLVRTVGGRYDALVAGSPSAGALLRWWLADRPGSLLADAEALPPGPTGYLVLPYPSGRQSPSPDPAAAVRIVPAPAGADAAVLTRAVVEGLALHARWMYQAQCDLAGAPGTAVLVLGGSAGSGLWLRLKAATLPVPVRSVAAAEPVAAGAALLAAARTGLAEAEPPALPSTVVGAPDPAYDAVFASFVREATA